MSKDVVDVVGEALGRAARDAVKNVSANARKRATGRMSGPTGLAAGAGLALLTPLAGRGASKLVRGLVNDGAAPLRQAGGKVTEAVSGGKLTEAASGGGGKIKEALRGAAPGASTGDHGDGDGDGESQGVPGVGKGRRMPVQQDIDIGVPLQTVYNQWTQFEEWPKFMHRVQQVSQDDESHVTFKTKIWGVSKTFKAEIVEQRPDERIKWRVTEGLIHNGVVTFHELAPRLTRVEVSLDVEPGSLLEKAARGMRHIKRAIRADLARFKAHVLMEEEESGAWRGEIDDAEVKPQRRSSSGGRSGSNGSSRSGGRSGSSRSRSASNRSRSTSSGSRSGSSGGGRSGSSRSRSASNRSRSTSSGSRSSSSGSRSTSGRSGSTSARSRSGSNGNRSGSSGSRRSSNGRSGSSRSGGSSSSRQKSGSRS